MPIYQYRCQECSELHEALQKMSDKPLTDCPACGKPQLKKVLAPVAIAFKGSGFHVNDYSGSSSAGSSSAAKAS